MLHYFRRTQVVAVRIVQIKSPLPRNQKPGLAPGFFVPESDPSNDRLSAHSGHWASIGLKGR